MKRVGTFLLRATLVGVSTFVIFLLVCVPTYVFPAFDNLEQASDAVLVLGPATRERQRVARDLVARGLAETVVLSAPKDGLAPDGTGTGRLASCNKPDGAICFMPLPTTTRGEARAFRDLAEKYGWKSVVIVTETPHVTRARVIFERCFDGDIRFAEFRSSMPPSKWFSQFFVQTGAFVKVLAEGTSC